MCRQGNHILEILGGIIGEWDRRQYLGGHYWRSNIGAAVSGKQYRGQFWGAMLGGAALGSIIGGATLGGQCEGAHFQVHQVHEYLAIFILIALVCDGHQAHVLCFAYIFCDPAVSLRLRRWIQSLPNSVGKDFQSCRVVAFLIGLHWLIDFRILFDVSPPLHCWPGAGMVICFFIKCLVLPIYFGGAV